MYAHHQDHVHLIEGGKDAFGGRLWVKRDANMDAKFADLTGCGSGIGDNLHVEIDQLHAALFGEDRGVLQWIGDHQVGIEIGLGRHADRLDDRRADRDIRDEMAVHYVEMDQVTAGAHHLVDLGGEDAEIGRQDRGQESGGAG